MVSLRRRDKGRVHCEVAERSVVDPLQAGGFFVAFVNELDGSGRKEMDKPKNPKSPVCIAAVALASLAMSLRADRRPRMSAIQRMRP